MFGQTKAVLPGQPFVHCFHLEQVLVLLLLRCNLSALLCYNCHYSPNLRCFLIHLFMRCSLISYYVRGMVHGRARAVELLLRRCPRDGGDKICVPATGSEMGTVGFKEKRATRSPIQLASCWRLHLSQNPETD